MPINIAHRGYSGRFPENTMRAFTEAVAAGARGIEFDVQLSRDGEPVVIHDEKLGRTAEGSGWVKDYTWKELRLLDAGGWLDEAYRGERIPHLEEVLDLGAAEGLLMNLELKTGTLPYPGLAEKAVKMIDRKRIVDRMIVSSFNHRTVQELAGMNPDLPTAIIYAAGMFEPWNYAGLVNAGALHPGWDFVDQYLVDGAHRAGMLVNTWTVNESEQMDAMIALGVDGIITNFPNRLAEKLRNDSHTVE